MCTCIHDNIFNVCTQTLEEGKVKIYKSNPKAAIQYISMDIENECTCVCYHTAQSLQSSTYTCMYIHNNTEGQCRHTYHSLEDYLGVGISSGVDHSRAVYEVDTPHQRNVLPHLDTEEG